MDLVGAGGNGFPQTALFPIANNSVKKFFPLKDNYGPPESSSGVRPWRGWETWGQSEHS